MSPDTSPPNGDTAQMLLTLMQLENEIRPLCGQLALADETTFIFSWESHKFYLIFCVSQSGPSHSCSCCSCWPVCSIGQTESHTCFAGAGIPVPVPTGNLPSLMWGSLMDKLCGWQALSVQPQSHGKAAARDTQAEAVSALWRHRPG